jgi:signal transduction histidine kinase
MGHRMSEILGICRPGAEAGPAAGLLPVKPMLSRDTPTDEVDLEVRLSPRSVEFEARENPQEPDSVGVSEPAVETDPLPTATAAQEGDRNRVIWAMAAVATVIAAVIQLAWVPDYRPMAAPFELPWWTFILAFAAAEVFIIHLPVQRDTHTISLSEMATVLGFAFVAPHLLIAARVAGSALALGVYRRQRMVKLAFNMSLFYLDLAVALAVYRAVLGDASPNSPTGWVAAMVAAGAAVVVSAALVTTIVWLHDRERSRANILRSLAAGSLIPVGTSLVGVLCLIVLWQDPRAAFILIGAAALFYLLIRAYGRLSKRHDDLRAIYSFTETIHAGLTDSEMQIELLAAAQEHLRARVAELVIRDPASRAFAFARITEDGELTQGAANEARVERVAVFDTFTDRAISFRSGAELPAEGAMQSALHPFGFETGLAAPLYVDGDLIGVIAVGNRLGPIHTFDEADHSLIEAMAQHASLTIERLRLTESLQSEVETNHALLESKDHLLASVSHELRTPLTGILGFAELVRDSGNEMDDTDRQSMVGAIAAEALDLSNLVEDLLTAAKSSAGKLTITPTAIELRAVVDRVLEAHAPSPPRTVQVRGDLVPAVADPARVRQVVRNLLTNAERYGGESILVTIRSDAHYSYISVADDGSGVDSPDAESIFGAYQSAHQPAGRIASVGIGLTISRALARLMRGDLTYRRESGWTIFELTLPGPNTATRPELTESVAPTRPDTSLRRRGPARPTTNGDPFPLESEVGR